MNLKVTIKDVAKHAGVSVGTVSKILNAGSSSTEKGRRVHDAIQALNYRPNLYARAVRSSHTGCIGLLLEKNVYTSSSLWLDCWLSSLLLAITRTKYRSEVLTIDSADPDFDCGSLSAFDGLISFGHFEPVFWEKMELTCPIPLVTYFEPAPYRLGFSFEVHLDDGMEKIARHLYDFGHRNIAFLASTHKVAQTKMRKFGEAMQKVYPEYDTRLLISHEQLGSATETAMYLTDMVLARYPNVTTVFYESDSYANSGLCTLMQRRLRLAVDISMVSYDRTSWSRNFVPAITSVGIDFRKTAQMLVDLLIAIIKNDPDAAEQLKRQKIMLEYFPGNSVRNLKINPQPGENE